MVRVEVVAAAILRDGRVLAARRTRPATLAGGWEFPGGKVESGESHRAALAREIAEELGVPVEVGARLGDAADGPVHLTLYAARLLDGEPGPGAGAGAGADHDALRWLAVTELGAPAWLPIDRALLPAVAAQLSREVRAARGPDPG